MPCGHLYCKVSGWNRILSLNKTSSAETIFRANGINSVSKAKHPLHCTVLLALYMTFPKVASLMYFCTDQMFSCVEDIFPLCPPNFFDNITVQNS